MSDPNTSGHELVGGRYRLLEPAGPGSGGRVWHAEDELLHRPVAIKEIGTPADITVSRMLDLQLATMREARAAARLDHPGVVQVYDVVWRPGRSWIVMEYVRSRSLHQVVADRGPLPSREAARIGAALLGALRAAHAAGVLHRDVKPSNVLLADDGRVLLSDFGLAAVEGGEHGADPRPGSPGYAAPERLTGDRAGAPADLWSLGATLHTAVQGRPPFQRATTADTLRAVLSDRPDAAPLAGPLAEVITALLVKDPARRMTAAQAEPRLRRIADRAVGVAPMRLPRPTRFRGNAGRPASRGPDRRPGEPAARGAGPTGWPFPFPTPRRDHQPERPATRGGPHREPGQLATPGAGPARSTRIAVAVAVAVLVGTAGAALAVDSVDGPADRQPPVAAAAPADSTACPLGRPAGDPVGGPAGDAASGRQRYDLPAGWRWHRDDRGFTVAVPPGWTRAVDGSVTCFQDADGSRTFAVETVPAITDTPVEHWVSTERAALAGGVLPDYRLVALGPLDLAGGGAEWEYTWRPADGVRRHERRMVVPVGADRAYVLAWLTRDQDWASNEPVQRLVLASLS